MVFRVERDFEVTPADGLAHIFVLILGVDHDNVGVEHEGTEDFELGHVRLSGTGFREDD